LTDFRLETIVLDLPPLAGAFSRRLHDAGVPVTPARAADFARSLGLTRPVSRRRLYAVARAVFVTDPAQRAAFDRVFREVFGALDPSPPANTISEPAAAVSPPPASSPPVAEGRSPRHRGAAETGSGEDGEPIEVPVAIASDEERLAGKRFDALEPHELAQLYRLMVRLELVTPERRTRRYEKGRHGQRIDMRRTLRGSLRTGGGGPAGSDRRRCAGCRAACAACRSAGRGAPSRSGACGVRA